MMKTYVEYHRSDNRVVAKIALVPSPKEQHMSPSPRCAMQDGLIEDTYCGAGVSKHLKNG
jgi:hypothetical protein